MIRTKRAYDQPSRGDGTRFLVDQLWPRGIKKDDLELAGWLRQVAPSSPLRKWFGHDPTRWTEFRRKYLSELARKPEAWGPLLEAAKNGDVTLVFGAKDIEHNNALALQAFLQKKLKAKRSTRPRSPRRNLTTRK